MFGIASVEKTLRISYSKPCKFLARSQLHITYLRRNLNLPNLRHSLPRSLSLHKSQLLLNSRLT